MGEFVSGLRERATGTAQSLAAARDTGDDYAVEVHTAELLDLTRLASEHGVDLRSLVPDELGGVLIDLTAHEPGARDLAEPTAC
ncbi:hypothetical protein EV189_3369 [Motilibacter rhizosphaerae]|uniref:Uncharacterized protein n=1 Tax=Motilibacter rhizosphaerae TaxID=598652 RepID=A0A4Q7NGD7_9ACTN|nr:hypothetical protein [Motilibacter rhizosphaerae]RZS82971.1 hypothetical protein EV189_3369 [Motilibacter rhizosphaerae]